MFAMKWLFNIGPVFCLWVAVLCAGCGRQTWEEAPGAADSDEALKVSVRLSGKAGDPESALRTLRLFVFSEADGSMLLNKLYNTSEAVAGVPSGNYTYFCRTAGGNYQISELLPKGDIRIALVANEAAALNGSYTLDRLKGSVVNYYGMYEESGSLNIRIDGQSSTSNRGYIPMYAESGLLTHAEWNSAGGKTVDMWLVRTLAKVELQLNKEAGGITNLEPGDKLTISSASIIFVPEYSYLGNEGLPYDNAPVNTSQQSFSPALEITSGSGVLSSDVLSFYVPEHLLSDLTFDAGKYTYLRINAAFYSDQTKETTNSVYKIPIGNGVTTTSVAGLSKADLSVTRNTVYRVKARVKSIGQLEVFQIKVEIKPWEKTEDVDGDIDGAWLNVTSTYVEMSQKVVRVYFWSNQPALTLGSVGQVAGGGDFTVNDVFLNLSPGDHFKVFAEGDPGYAAYNGYMDLEFANAALYRTNETYTLLMKAGGLKRSFTVVANPKVGEIVFDANGGLGEYTQTVSYADLNDKALLGAEVTVTVPMDRFTAPAGKEFSLWVGENGDEVVQGGGVNQFVVKLTGYTTKVKALWKDKI